jgi:hypothetical protein
MGCNVQYQKIQKGISRINGTIYSMPPLSVVPMKPFGQKPKVPRKYTRKSKRALTLQKREKAEKELLKAADRYKALIKTKKAKKIGGARKTKRRNHKFIIPISNKTQKCRQDE